MIGRYRTDEPTKNSSTHIADWFNVNDPAHIAAYKRLCDTGAWPEGFIPEFVERPPSWQMVLMSRLAEAWVNHMLDKQQ